MTALAAAQDPAHATQPPLRRGGSTVGWGHAGAPLRRPLARSSTPATAANRPRLLPPELSVLTVSSHSGLRSLVETTLLPAGVAGLHFLASPESLFQTIKDKKIRLVILDDSPPALDALDLTLHLRRDPESPNPRLHIFAALGLDSIERTLEALACGVHEVLFKPFRPNKLVSLIKSSLRERRDFIEVNGYVGPNRRRISAPEYRGPLRRENDRPFDL